MAFYQLYKLIAQKPDSILVFESDNLKLVSKELEKLIKGRGITEKVSYYYSWSEN